MENKKLLLIIGLLIVVVVAGALYYLSTDESSVEFRNNIQEAMNDPNADKDIDIRNEYSEPINITVTIVNNSTGDEVYNESYSIDANSNLDSAYNLQELNPDGVQEYRVGAEYNGTRESVTVKTNNCFGDVIIEVTQDGTVYPFYAIC